MQLYMQLNPVLFVSYLVQKKLSNQGHFPGRIASAYFGLTLARCDSFLVRSCFPECSLRDLRWCGIIGASRDIYSPSLNKSPSQTVHGNTFHEEFSDIGPFLVREEVSKWPAISGKMVFISQPNQLDDNGIMIICHCGGHWSCPLVMLSSEPCIQEPAWIDWF
jgi:hypothetical protein